MFTQRLSMDCTKEQYEKYLKDELLKMGYDDSLVTFWKDETVIVNNGNGQMGALGTFIGVRKERHDRTYLGSFNAPLFLALAAMTDNPIGIDEEYYTNGRNLFIRKFVLIKAVSIDGVFRKATKDEIMARFSEKKCNHNTLKNKIDQLNEKGKIKANIPFDTTELEREMSRFIDEVCDSIEKSHIDALKSKGYKILKKTETWEEV